jgi:REP element-mobilizing transposase RayT
MPRHRRRTVRGTVIHLISRVTDGEYRIDDGARVEYLRRLGRVAARIESCILAYALMSSHVHLALYCLGVPVSKLIHPVHTGFGNWLNDRDNRGIHVFRERPKTLLFDPSHAPTLIAYLHNNPVRARVVDRAADTKWTSHRAYIGAGRAPAWLRVDQGLKLSGLDTTRAGRATFAELVASTAIEPRSSLYSGDDSDRDLCRLRRQLNAPVDLSTPLVGESETELPLIGVPGMPVVERWDGELGALVAAASCASGVRVSDILSRRRTPNVTRARCLVVLTGAVHLGLTTKEVAASIGLSKSAGSKLLLRNPQRRCELEPLAVLLAGRLRTDVA